MRLARPVRLVTSLTVAAALAFPAPVAARTVLDSTAVGIGEVLRFHDRTDEIAVPIPVPRGLMPRTLTATAQTPVDMERGHLEAWSGDLLLERIPLDGDEESARIDVPLERAEIRNGVVDLTLRTVLNSRGDTCPDWTHRSLVLRDGDVIYEGEPEAPRVLADFIPSVLKRLEIYLPDEPSPVESEAAAQLALTAAARFGKRGLEIDVLPVSGPRAASASPFTRRAEIREAPEARFELTDADVPTAVITGDAASLARQSRSVSSELRSFAITDTVTLDTPLPAPRALMTEATLDDLGIGSLTARSVGTVSVDFGLDQTRTAGVAGEMTVDLRGTYSPPPGDRSGLIVVTAGETVLDSWTADDSGSIERTVTVPADAVNRYTEITVALQTAGTGTGAACGLVQPLTMLVNGSTRVHLTDPVSPAPKGFNSLPQALMPRVQIATGAGTLEETARVVDILANLQALSAAPLLPEWVSMDTLLDSKIPGLLVTSEPASELIDLPLSLTSGRTLQIVGSGADEPSTLRFFDDIEFASMQVVEDGDRAVLVASTSSGSDELDRTLDWLDAKPDRWSALSGNVLFTAPDRVPISLSTSEVIEADPDSSTTTEGVRTALLVGLAVTVVGVVLAALWWLLTRRRRSAPAR